MFKCTKKSLTAVSLLALWSGQLCAMNSDEQDSADGISVTPRSTKAIQNEEVPQQVAPAFSMFSDLSPEVKREHIEFAAANIHPNVLRLVCREWRNLIDGDDTQRGNDGKLIQRGQFWKKLNKNYGYQIFLRGVLIYRPKKESDEGKIEMRVADLANPLDGTFELPQWNDELSISTGYRKVQNPANAKKLEIWLLPWFVADENMQTLPQNHHIRAIMGSWDGARAPIGIIWTWGGWDATSDSAYCGYLISESMEDLGRENIDTKWEKSSEQYFSATPAMGGHRASHFTFELK